MCVWKGVGGGGDFKNSGAHGIAINFTGLDAKPEWTGRTEFMYVLATNKWSLLRWQRANLMSETGLTFRHAATGSPLGRIAEGGFVRHGAGGGIRPWRTYGRYALVYLLDGSGAYADTRGVRQLLTPGDLVIVRPDLGHSYGATDASGSHWHEHYLAFDGPAFDLWARAGLLLDAARPVRHLEPVDTWLRHFRAVLGEPRGASALREICALQSLLADILAADPVPGQLGAAEVSADARWLARARALLDAAASDAIHHAETPLAATARQLGLSPESFRKRFTRLAGRPPARYCLARRIDRACELLSRGDSTIQQAAAATGFCDEFHFSRRFKQITGETPSHFRQRVRAAGESPPSVSLMTISPQSWLA